jgi:hypothetical protein
LSGQKYQDVRRECKQERANNFQPEAQKQQRLGEQKGLAWLGPSTDAQQSHHNYLSCGVPQACESEKHVIPDLKIFG